MNPISPSTPTGKRRRYSPEFKTHIVAACRQPDQSVASVALAHGLNANLVHKWIRNVRQSEEIAATAAFLPLAVPQPSCRISSPTAECVRIEVVRGAGSVLIEWPLSDASGCHTLLKDIAP